jgi:hypothetical protein
LIAVLSDTPNRHPPRRGSHRAPSLLDAGALPQAPSARPAWWCRVTAETSVCSLMLCFIPTAPVDQPLLTTLSHVPKPVRRLCGADRIKMMRDVVTGQSRRGKMRETWPFTAVGFTALIDLPPFDAYQRIETASGRTIPAMFGTLARRQEPAYVQIVDHNSTVSVYVNQRAIGLSTFA